MSTTITSKKTLLIIAICAFFQSFSIVISPDFYLNELIKDFDISNPYYLHIKLLIICCGVLGVSLSVLTYVASRLDETTSKIMLRGVSIAQSITFVLLMCFLLFTPLNPPLFIIFLTLIFSIISFSFSK